MECPVCLVDYDETMRRPRTMPCGHTVCSPCIDGLRNLDHVTCPTCRTSNAVPVTGQFPLSYAVEDLLRRLRDAASDPAAANADTNASQWEASCLGHKIRSLLQEQEAKVLNAISTCLEIQAQLGEYQTTLAGWCEQQQRLEDCLQTVIEESRNARELVQQEASRVAAKRGEANEETQQLNAVLGALRRVTSPEETYTAIDNSDRCTTEVEQRVGECRGMFPDVVAAAAARKAMEATSAALKAAQRVQTTQDTAANAAEEPHPLPDPAWTIDDTFRDLLVPPALTVKELRSLSQSARRLLSAGLVFAVHEVEGQQRYSRITIAGNQVFLHVLQDLPLPRDAAILQLSEVLPPYPPCMVFLDLSWRGSMPQRVEVRLSRNTPLGRQFVLLCTGQSGPSYANTRLFKIGAKGQPGEFVLGGDYESNDGERGAALMPGLAKGNYWRSGRAGAVSGGGWFGNSARGAQFGITTRNLKRGGVYGGVFGEVVKGIDIVVAAAQHSNIREVTVVDCGVVLWR